MISTINDNLRSLSGALEDVQYHLYVIGKIRKGIERAETEGAIPQEEVERRLSKWTSK